MKKTKKFVLFIGGPSCSGKTTVSKIIAGPDSRAKKPKFRKLKIFDENF